MYVLHSLTNVKPPRNPLLHGHTVQVGCHGLMILVILSPCPSVRSPSRCHLFLFVFDLPVVKTIQGLHPHRIHKGLLGFPNSMVRLHSIHSLHQIRIRSKLGTMIASPGSGDLHELGCSTDFPLGDWQKRSDSSANVQRDCASPSHPHLAPPFSSLKRILGFAQDAKKTNYRFASYGGHIHTNGTNNNHPLSKSVFQS